MRELNLNLPHLPPPPTLLLWAQEFDLFGLPQWASCFGLDSVNAGKKGAQGKMAENVSMGSSDAEVVLCPCCAVSSLLHASTQGHSAHLLASSTEVLSFWNISLSFPTSLQGQCALDPSLLMSLFSFIYLFIYCHIHGTQKFPDWGLNPRHCWAPGELPDLF